MFDTSIQMFGSVCLVAFLGKKCLKSFKALIYSIGCLCENFHQIYLLLYTFTMVCSLKMSPGDVTASLPLLSVFHKILKKCAMNFFIVMKIHV